MRIFTKKPAGPQSTLAEAAGLLWLGAASGAVAEVVSVDEHQLSTVYVAPATPTPEMARTAGRELARIHLAGAPAFGSPPPGWEGPNYIGTQAQDCIPAKAWGEFYAEQRVLPFAEKAYRRSHLSGSDLETVERAARLIKGWDVDVEPARLHGDLWSENLLFGESGPIMIDPAAHGGHPETDLAMLALFGAPHLDEIRAGYQEINPLPGDWISWTPLHQLHPLAVHTASHGPSYGQALIRAAHETIELLG